MFNKCLKWPQRSAYYSLRLCNNVFRHICYIYTISSRSSVLLHVVFASLYIIYIVILHCRVWFTIPHNMYIISCILRSCRCFPGIRFVFFVVIQVFCCPTVCHFLKLSMFSFTAVCTSSFHHRDSVTTFLWFRHNDYTTRSLQILVASRWKQFNIYKLSTYNFTWSISSSDQRERRKLAGLAFFESDVRFHVIPSRRLTFNCYW